MNTLHVEPIDNSASLTYVEGDPDPTVMTQVVTERVDGRRARYFARGVLAGINLVHAIEDSPTDTVVLIEESFSPSSPRM